MEVLRTFGIVLVIILGYASRCQSLQMAPLSPMELMHEVSLDQLGNYILKWTPREKDIIFEVQAKTTGYIGFGFSPNGGMKGADVIIGGVDDETGQVYLKDRFATDYTVPKVDEFQDVRVLGGHQNGTHTSLRFSRPWFTCHSNEDLELSEDDTVRVIWSYGTSDPLNGDPMAITYHSERGSKSLYLNEPPLQLPQFSSDVKTWDLRSPNVRLPDDIRTLYWCKIFKIPPLRRKTHVIGYIPIISDDNIQHVHHILLYECHLPDSEKYLQKWLEVDGAQCFGANMPFSWGYCTSPIIAWAVGGEGSFTPDHVGFPLGEEHGGSTYFMMEIHYDNPNLRQGIVDNSGLKIFHTENLRPNEAGILMLGHHVSPLHIVPPGREWLTVGICSSNCTREKFPPNGVKVFAGFLHAHLLGRNMTLRHVRNKKELPIIQKDLNYDFNFQETRNFKKEVTFLPGDSFITECGLDSRGRGAPTFGGLGTKEEMCLGFLYYYPRVDLAFCGSGPSRSNIFKSLGINKIYPPSPSKGESGDQYGIDEAAESELADELKTGRADSKLKNLEIARRFGSFIVKEPAEHKNQSLYDILTSKETWRDEAMVQRFQDAVISGAHSQYCSQKNESRHSRMMKPKDMILTYPVFQPLPPSLDKCKKDNEIGIGKTLPCHPQLGCNLRR